MAPQLWIAIVLFTIMLITKISLIIYSRWYEKTQYFMGMVHTELIVLTVAILINLFALYGLNCSIKGGCTVYSYIIIAILIVAMILTMYGDIIGYKMSKS